MNRAIKCKDCGERKWMSQKQWRTHLELWKTPQKIRRRFQCAVCKRLEKNEPLEYYIKYGKPMKKLQRELKKFFKEYWNNHEDVATLQKQFNESFLEYNIAPDAVTYHMDENKRLLAVSIKCLYILGEKYEDVRISLWSPKTRPNY